MVVNNDKKGGGEVHTTTAGPKVVGHKTAEDDIEIVIDKDMLVDTVASSIVSGLATALVINRVLGR